MPSPPKPPKDRNKATTLRERGSLHPNADAVVDPLFVGSDFFDARDLLQVKYEMLRRVRVDAQPVSHTAAAFGLSRPCFYQAQEAFDRGGIVALLPRKPGPRRAHKLDADVVTFIEQQLLEQPSLRPPQLAERVLAHFGRTVHPRSIERALARQKKKRHR